MTTTLFCDVCGAALTAQESPCPACGYVQTRKEQDNLPAQQPQKDELHPGSLLMGRYRIQKTIGEGGFGLVYKAWDQQTQSVVAIKQITLTSLTPRQMIDATTSYNREITILKKVRHTNLPKLYDHFTDPGHWYICMQYIEGRTLEEKLAKAPRKRLPVREVLFFGKELCSVLGYLHTQEPPIIFRDVKPANIICESRTNRLYLIDFGIARRYVEGQSKDTGPLGSPGYAAPEQYGKAQSTPRTDMYGLGATLQTLLTGKEPWEIQQDGIPADCDIPSELQELINRLMDPDPDQRPAIMWSVGQSLRSLQKHYIPQAVVVGNPLAWLYMLWILFALAIGPLFLSNPIHLICFFMAVAGVILSTGYQIFFKRGRFWTKRLTVKDIRESFNRGTTFSSQLLFILWFYSAILFPMEVYTEYAFNITDFVRVLTYVAVSVAGWIILLKAKPSILKRIQRRKVAQAAARPTQMSPMEQKMP